MIVSRRSFLLSKPSAIVMRAAGRAASTEALHAIAAKQAHKQHAELMRRTGAKSA